MKATMKSQVKEAIENAGEDFASKGYITSVVTFSAYKTADGAVAAINREIKRLISIGEAESFIHEQSGVCHYSVIA